ncbi:hypothetical protein QI30_07095 [Kurthia sp. 3B1D]|uniref:Uncharacterized protein n=2 Tax=Kurthia TaxID=1649 RepID=A0A433RVP0_9BACL|nr:MULTISPECIES: hypothetical protein [unclassified Kurthia]RUS57338.1 hypothetical protein QI30_07095 [Kurthia sp. 3B1D]HIX44566.1 hypothetical protein [Candidatus Kurthia intestinigallinarum]
MKKIMPIIGVLCLGIALFLSSYASETRPDAIHMKQITLDKDTLSIKANYTDNSAHFKRYTYHIDGDTLYIEIQSSHFVGADTIDFTLKDKKLKTIHTVYLKDKTNEKKIYAK